MKTFVYEVKSAKGVHIEQLNQELLMIIHDYNSVDYPTKTQLTSYTNNIILTSPSLKSHLFALI